VTCDDISDDFGGEAFRDPLEILYGSLTAEARLTPLGSLQGVPGLLRGGSGTGRGARAV